MTLEAELEAAIEQQRGTLSDIHLNLLNAQICGRPTSHYESRMAEVNSVIRDLKKELTKLGERND